MIHTKIRITGKVQGVSFRNTARGVANRLNLQGFARNESDGSVYIEVEGNDTDIQEFIGWCQKGTPGSKVTDLESSTHEPVGHNGFYIG